jgi:hypothetical protein
MEVSTMRDEEQKESQAKSAAGDVISRNENAATSGDRESGERKKIVRRDPHAAQKLAKKKRMRAAHHRRLKASHAKG